MKFLKAQLRIILIVIIILMNFSDIKSSSNNQVSLLDRLKLQVEKMKKSYLTIDKNYLDHNSSLYDLADISDANEGELNSLYNFNENFFFGKKN